MVILILIFDTLNYIYNFWLYFFHIFILLLPLFLLLYCPITIPNATTNIDNALYWNIVVKNIIIYIKNIIVFSHSFFFMLYHTCLIKAYKYTLIKKIPPCANTTKKEVLKPLLELLKAEKFFSISVLFKKSCTSYRTLFAMLLYKLPCHLI